MRKAKEQTVFVNERLLPTEVKDVPTTFSLTQAYSPNRRLDEYNPHIYSAYEAVHCRNSDFDVLSHLDHNIDFIKLKRLRYQTT